MKYVVAIGGPLLFVLLLLAASLLFPAQAPRPGSSTSGAPASTAGSSPTPITIYSGQPCLDFTAVGSSRCTVSDGKGEITADFAITSHCSGDETIEAIFAYEVTSTTGETGMASWDPIQDINIAPGQTVNVQHKIDKFLPDTDSYHFRLVIHNQKGALSTEFTTEETPICYP